MTAALWSPRLPYPGATDYYDRYVERYKEAPDYHGAEAYAAVLVAADVLERAESFTPEATRSALNDTNLETLFGQVRFLAYDKFERQNNTPTVVLKVADSKFEFVWSENFAATSLSTP